LKKRPTRRKQFGKPERISRAKKNFLELSREEKTGTNASNGQAASSKVVG